jgi:hypothetical protein
MIGLGRPDSEGDARFQVESQKLQDEPILLVFKKPCL